MEIFVRLEAAEHDGDSASHQADLAIGVEPSHTVGDVAAAIAEFIGRPPGTIPTLSRRGTGALNPATTVADSGILSGETLVLGSITATPRRRPAELRLIVASGPDAGASFPLEPGDHTIGRDANCDIVLTDPQISRRHLTLTVHKNRHLTLETLVSERNEVRTTGHRLVGANPIAVDQVVRVGASTLVVREAPTMQRNNVDAFGQVPFHRTPYFPTPVESVVIQEIKDVPTRPEKPRFVLLAILAPIVMGVSLALFIGSPRYLLLAFLSPTIAIGNFIETRRRSGRTFTAAVERFEQALAIKADEVRQALSTERRRRFVGAPDVADIADRAEHRAIDLWVRHRDASDFLTLRVGLGDVPTEIEAKIGDRGDTEFRDQIQAAYGETHTVTDVPVALKLAELGVVGLVGRAMETSSLASSLAIQATGLHSPEDLILLGAFAPARHLLEQLKWTPHSRSTSSPLAGPHLVGTKGAADGLIRDLITEAANRSSVAKDRQSRDPRFPWLLLLLDRALEPDPALVSRLLDLCPTTGISVVWLTDTRERVPRQAQAIVECQSPLTGDLSRILFTDPTKPDLYIDIDRLGPQRATLTAQALAPLRDASATNAATALPRVVPLFTAFGIEAIDADWVATQWQTRRGYSVAGPIGLTESGPLHLDMVTHGPHGLIGGTSGAGKSELVMSIVASLVAHNPPTKVNVLFVDYKGGASSDLFKDVPHTVGYVTNLDGLLSMRALTSLRAELNRRMDLLKGRAKDLAEMIERYPEEAPPSLVIVVDEFATLVKEIPDFVAGIVDIAQRGRSLGIHLILATQRPSGSVNDNIKANTNLRISLRMLDSSESNAVIGTADAAALPAPLKGRGFARLGPGELVAFQSAWAGAPLLADTGPPPVTVEPFGHTPLPPAALARQELPTRHRNGLTKNSPGDAQTPAKTQVSALLDAVIEATKQLAMPNGRPPWLDVLPAVIPIEEVRRAATNEPAEQAAVPGERVAIGMIDDPAAQAQYPLVTNLARSGGLIAFGTGGTGKSTMLKTAALSASLDDSERGGGGLTIFAIDFASRELGALNALPQCAAVAASDDMEAVTRVITVLHETFELRRQALADAVARSAPPPEHSRVLLLVDGLDALIQTMEAGASTSGLIPFYEKLTQLLVDGRQVGIYPILAAARRAGVRSTIMSAISDRITLRQADAQGYLEAGLRSSEAADVELDPGQGLYNGPTMVQIAKLTDPALAGNESLEVRETAERERLVAVAGGLTGWVDPDLRTGPLPRSAEVLPSDDPLRPVVGVADLTLKPIHLDLTYNNVAVYGDPRTGRSTALATIGHQVMVAGGEVWVVAPPHSRLVALDGVHRTCSETGDALMAFLDELTERAASEPRPDRLLLLDDVDLLDESNRQLMTAVSGALLEVSHVAATTRVRGYSASPVQQELKKCRTIVHLCPLDGRDTQEVIGVVPQWHPGLAMTEGRGYIAADRIATMAQFSDVFADEPSI